MGMSGLAVFLIAFAAPLFAITPVPLMKRQIQSFGPDLSPDHFGSLCQRIDQPCGLEMLRNSDPSLAAEPLKPLAADKSVQDALDAIVARAPQYRWKYHEYSINLMPKEIPKDDPLDRILKHVSLKGMSSTRAALSVLEAAHVLGSYQGPGHLILRRIPDIELMNISVREALNRIAVADGHAMWIVSPLKNKKELSLFFVSWEDKYQITEHDLKDGEYEEEKENIRDFWTKRHLREAAGN